MNRIVGFAFALFVVAAVTIAFGERSDPPMPATEVRIEHLLMLDAQPADTRIVAVGERGRVFLSDDRGRHWRSVPSPTEAMLTALAAVDRSTLVAIGHDSVILRSTDGGLSWDKVFEAPQAEEPLLALRFDAAGRGFAVGAYGRFLQSEDGGRGWTERDLDGNDFHFNAIVAVGDSLILAGEAGTLLRSDDGGMHWFELESPYEGSFFGALALHDGTLLVFGMRGHVFRSDDRGESWEEVPTGTDASIFGGGMLADGSVVLVGQSGLLLVADPDARQFTRVDTGSSRSFVAVTDGAATGEVLLFGDEGVLVVRLQRPGGGS